MGARHMARSVLMRCTMKQHKLLLGGLLLSAAVSLLLTLLLWDRIAVAMAPNKQVATERSSAALAADTLFWSTFHGARYDDIQRALDVLTAAYLDTPNDDITAAHIGWMHMWRVGERARAPNASATITDDLVLAHKYFGEALKLHPDEPRYLGFYAAALMSEGHIDADEALVREGYFTMKRAVKLWPEFNLFTSGYVLSHAPVDSAQFAEALEQQWQNMEACVKTKLDRHGDQAGDFARFMSESNKEGPARACWNSSIAPHNSEGFFLNMGDMLVKKGEWKVAQKIYHDATYLAAYPRWKYRDVLDARIVNAEQNVAEFNKTNPATPMMIDSAFACMGCHEE